MVTKLIEKIGFGQYLAITAVCMFGITFGAVGMYVEYDKNMASKNIELNTKVTEIRNEWEKISLIDQNKEIIKKLLKIICLK